MLKYFCRQNFFLFETSAFADRFSGKCLEKNEAIQNFHLSININSIFTTRVCVTLKTHICVTKKTAVNVSSIWIVTKQKDKEFQLIYLFTISKKIDIDIDAVMYIVKAWSVTGFLTARETENKGVTDTLKTSLWNEMIMIFASFSKFTFSSCIRWGSLSPWGPPQL